MALTNVRLRRGAAPRTVGATPPARTARAPRATRSARAARTPRVDPTTIRTPFGAALPAAAWSAAVGVAAVTVLVVIGWAAAPDAGTSPGLAVAAGGQAWLLAQGGDLTLANGSLTLTPLGLLILPAYVLARSGAWAARAADVRSWADAARTAGLLAVLYALLGLGVAFASTTATVRPQALAAFLATGAVALLAGGWGVLRASGLLLTLPAELPRQALPLLRGALGAVAVLVSGGALMVAASLIAHGRQVGDLWSSLDPDPAGVALLVLLCAALVPNAVLWAAAYAVGPGFAVGIGTSVAPTGVVVGAVPALPILGALPGAGPAPTPSLLSLALPVLAGVLAGAIVARDRHLSGDDPAHAALLAAGAGAVAGLALGTLTALSAGSLGGGRLVDLGPAGVQVALVAALEMAVVAGAVCWEWRRHLARRAARPAPTVDLRAS